MSHVGDYWHCALCEKRGPIGGMNLVGHAWLCSACSNKVPPSQSRAAMLAAASVDKLIEAIDRLTEAVESAAEARAE